MMSETYETISLAIFNPIKSDEFIAENSVRHYYN